MSGLMKAFSSFLRLVCDEDIIPTPPNLLDDARPESLLVCSKFRREPCLDPDSLRAIGAPLTDIWGGPVALSFSLALALPLSEPRLPEPGTIGGVALPPLRRNYWEDV